MPIEHFNRLQEVLSEVDLIAEYEELSQEAKDFLLYVFSQHEESDKGTSHSFIGGFFHGKTYCPI